jgi:hypothetical protein
MRWLVGKAFTSYTQRHWQPVGPARIRPVPLPSGELVDDVGFILSFLDELIRERVIDPAHVIAVLGRIGSSTSLVPLPGIGTLL